MLLNLTDAELKGRIQKARACFVRPVDFRAWEISENLPRFTCRILDVAGNLHRENRPILLSDNGNEILSFIPPGEPLKTKSGGIANYQPTVYRHWRDKARTFAYIYRPRASTENRGGIRGTGGTEEVSSDSGSPLPELREGAGVRADYELDWIYANICRLPTFDGRLLLTTDLILDVLIWPDGAYHVEDEDELAEMLRIGSISHADAAMAREAAKAVIGLVESRDAVVRGVGLGREFLFNFAREGA